MFEKLIKDFKANLVPIAVVIAGLIVGGAVIYTNQGVEKEKEGEILGGSSTPQQVAQAAIDYINQYLLPEGITASLINATETSGVYKFHLEIGGQGYDSYVTKDGKLLFAQGINLEKNPEVSPKSSLKGSTCEDITKTNKPLLEAFIVSQCPHGLQMQRILNEIVKNIPNLAGSIRVEYIGSVQGGKVISMHGDKEAEENLRQICIREEQPAQYWNYLDCYIQKGEEENCLTRAGVNIDKLNSCMSDNLKGLEYAKKDFDLSEQYQAGGSPDLFLNGEEISEFDFGGRTAEAVKTLLCCGFSQEPEYCSQELSKEPAAISFSEAYSGGSGSGSCQ